jgi:hypothetical protein
MARHATVVWHTADRFTLRNLRNWSWDEGGSTDERWEDRRYSLSGLRGLWFNVERFPAAPALAHTFLTFEFDAAGTPAFLTVSVEARREIGERYSPFRGLDDQYELIFVWSTEKDIVTEGVRLWGHEIETYPVTVTPDQAARILRGFLERTDQLAQRPEFYNTFRHNCTTELAAVVNREFDTPIPWDLSFVLTGTSARYLHRLGYLGDPEAPFAPQMRRARIGDEVRRLAELPETDFSRALRSWLRRP